ncbi:response regulator [Melioribacteraceae bacterium 4301-Me]|uniref:response regulator n=1 Tax=Pyranulibacter aquaticus TaxID=3163344 RepID=UPI00359A84D1
MENKSKIEILIADDHSLFRSGIISLLNEVKDIQVIGEASNGKELIQKYFLLRPDVILIDISMPEISGIDAFKQIKKRDKNVKALFLTMYDGEEYIYYTMKIGAMGLLNKNIVKEELCDSIRMVANKIKYFGRKYTNEMLEEMEAKFKSKKQKERVDILRLSPKEKQILYYVSQGLTSLEISDKLKIGKRTIDTHRARIMHKMKIKSLPEFISFAIKVSNLQQIEKKQ